MEYTLGTPVQYIQRVGPTMAGRLERLGIRTIRDLLYYAPFRYNDYSKVTPIRLVKHGEKVSVTGMVQSMKNVFTRTGKRLQRAVVADDTGAIQVTWFNQTYLTNVIKPGDTISLAGTPEFFGSDLTFMSPEYEIISSAGESLHTGRIVPVYPETEGVSSKWLRGRIAYALSRYGNLLVEYLPPFVVSRLGLMPISTAAQWVHFPPGPGEAVSARKRLAFDELLYMRLVSYEQKRSWEETRHAPKFKLHPDDIAAFVRSLPFTLTPDQQEAVREILSDLTRPFPMNRLLEGDVGSGKTVVGAIAMLEAYLNGHRSILMAPTQILAEQHFATVERLLAPLGIPVALITGAEKFVKTGNTVEKIQKTAKKGRKGKGKPAGIPADVIIGTHALLSEERMFTHTGLIVIDEQQRFGVKQRALLRAKTDDTAMPHLLTMTATPIPRTLALTMYGNLDVSELKSMPHGRKTIKTWLVPEEKRVGAYGWIKKQISEGAQVFVVCPFIDESDTLTTVRAVKKEFDRLSTDVFPGYRLGLLHGRMKPKEKTEVLTDFKDRKYDILVTTPVVEVGIDIPGATIMLIEASDRFGLSQLHQLRGRVGRSDRQSYCLLFTEETDETIITRLKALETIHNGPDLAQLDLALRGPGDLFGARQHGIPPLALASLKDEALLAESKTALDLLTHEDPTLSQFALLRQKLNDSTIQTIAQD